MSFISTIFVSDIFANSPWNLKNTFSRGGVFLNRTQGKAVKTAMSTATAMQGVEVFALPSTRSFGLNLILSLN